MGENDNVHIMNKINIPSQPESSQYRSLQILDELANNDSLTQRDLSQRLGIALGLVNSYIKNLASKGYITVRNIPAKRYAYYLTPNGFAEKTRLAYNMLNDYTRIYREAKSNFRMLFQDLERERVQKIVFAGADEVAEIAYITLQEVEHLELVGIVDNDIAGKVFLKKTVMPLAALGDLPYERILVTSYLKRQELYAELLSQGVQKKDIKLIFALRS